MSNWLSEHKILLIVLFIIVIGTISGIFSVRYISSEEEELIGSADIENTSVEEETPLPPEESKEEQKNNFEKKLMIDIKGAIKSPGVYEVTENTRINEVIEIAGGLAANAITKNINLSKKVNDEMVIYIFTEKEYNQKFTCPIKNEQEAEISKEISDKNSVITNSKNNSKDKISLNSGTLQEFQTLEGIGESKALKIIEYREKMKGFKSIEELKEVSGIGEALYEQIKGRLTL